MDELQPGLVGEARTTVDRSNVASAFGSGHVDVFATPAMIALMENAAINAVDHLLAEGSATVGSAVSVRHLAATPIGLGVRARAELLEADGRRLSFRVEAFDPTEKIGDGTHERYIVNLERLISRAASKGGAASA
jgi:fluoroacetyl-CoA thioesterase